MLLLGVAMTAARTLRAQQKAIPVIGFLHSGSPGPYAPYVAAFRQGLSETGYAEGQNVAIEYRWAEGRYDRLPALAAELVESKVDVIAALGGTPTALAGRCHGNGLDAKSRRGRTLFHATATASCHRAAASALKILSVDRETRCR
jgi:ABC-type uncharacterized transport system substrate-binding protein